MMKGKGGDDFLAFFFFSLPASTMPLNAQNFSSNESHHLTDFGSEGLSLLGCFERCNWKYPALLNPRALLLLLLGSCFHEKGCSYLNGKVECSL